MPITFPFSTDEARQFIFEHMKSVQAKQNLFKGVNLEGLTVADSFQSYIVSSQDIISGQLLSPAKPANWHYFVMRGTNAIGTAEVKSDAKTGRVLKVVAYSQAPAPELQTALEKARQFPQVGSQSYEFRYLNLSPIYFRAAWLHGKTDDILIPLPPTYRKWDAYHAYSESEVIKILKELIRERDQSVH